MATAAANLATARNNIAQQLADMTADPKPSYSVDGKSVSWGEHFSNLTNLLRTIEENIQVVGGPFEIRSWGGY